MRNIFARSLLDYSPVVLLGRVADTGSDDTQLDVEVVYKGELVARITLDQTQEEVAQERQNAAISGYPDLVATGPGDCSVVLLGRPGERYVLGLAESDEVIGEYSD
jgi:hypothetical protein